MIQETFFQHYIEIINDGLKKIKKISFKKFSLINELFQTLETYLAKQVYGRIEPSNYLLFFLVVLGGKNTKLYGPVIQTIQKIISNNYLNPSDDLSSSVRMLKDEHKEFLLLPLDQYSNKSFLQLYLQTLIALPDRSQQINLTICKNFSLIFRVSQNLIPVKLVKKICDFMFESISNNKSLEYDPILKSSFLQIIRHAVQSYKQVADRKFLQDDDQFSIKKSCEKHGQLLADRVAIQLEVKDPNYTIIPKNIESFKLLSFKLENEKGFISGKFGWCILCRKPANFYCRIQRVPVCGYQCKQINLFQNRNFFVKVEQLDKFYLEECKSIQLFANHIEAFCKCFNFYLKHQDIKKREVFASIFLHLSSELRKITIKSMTPAIKLGLQNIFKQCCFNVCLETQALVDCLKSVKKLMPLKIFIPQTAILFRHLGKKLTHFMTPSAIKVQILKFCSDLIKSQSLFESFMEIDCNVKRIDAVKELIGAISNLYIGVKPPEGINSLPPQEPQIRVQAFDLLMLLEKTLFNCNRSLDKNISEHIQIAKKQKNIQKWAIRRFNQTQKPVKMVKKLIDEKFFPNDASKIADFMLDNLKQLNFVNIGILVGDHTPLPISIRDQYIGKLKFEGHLVDEALRILLNHFTIPGQSQVVERIIECFSNVFYRQNKQFDTQNVFHHPDSVYAFSYLLMMLQTNLHNPQVVEKMTLAQFSNLSKNMNGEGLEFPATFLETIYNSIEAKQLGFHSKHKQIELIAAFVKGQQKKAQQIHSNELKKSIETDIENIAAWDDKVERTYDRFSFKLLANEFLGEVIDAVSIRIRECEDKDELLKCYEQIDSIIKFSLPLDLENFVAHSIKCFWEEITKSGNNSIKKYILTQKLFILAKQYTLYIYEKWDIVINLFSTFHRAKAIKKDNSGKGIIIAIIAQRCYLYDNFIGNIVAKSSKFNHKNLICMVEALINASKGQIGENHTPFSLEKIGDLLEVNNGRLADILPLIWNKLKEHYIELGCSKNQKIALFGTDFLKQLLTKFLKKKDLLFFQKQYLKPLQEIFNSNVALGVKEYIVGGLSYFVNNYFQNIKDGWKIILSILCDSFDEEEDGMVKEKSHGIVRKIYQSNFLVMDIDEYYVDFVQILGRMSHEKEDIYPKSCIDAIQTITTFYQKKLSINVDVPSAPENSKLDINFWQTMWLPLLSTIYGICGDFRADVQVQAIECMFDILMKYGKLFKYQFWKMIMQGILRPTFEEITYTSQSKSLPKKALEDWLRTSFTLLFESINKLICLYFNDFKLFLPDILKIYQSCILSNSNKILTQLSIEALTDLLCNVGELFEEMNWTEYIDFVDSVSRKGFPYQIESLQTWKKSQQNSIQNSYQGKCLNMNLLLRNCQTVLEKFSHCLLQKDIREIQEILQKTYQFCQIFNCNIELREILWKNGFFKEMKSLPGLLKHQHEALKAITICKFELSKKNEVNIDVYGKYFLSLLDQYRKGLITCAPTETGFKLEEQQRQNKMLHSIFIETMFPQIEVIGLKKLVEFGYKKFLLDHFLDCMAHKTFCSKCKTCINCEASGERELKFTENVKRLVKELFELKQ